ncbi:hypothetical protein KY363_08225 [Candidatus Woesearchaeota archaeon]|nr:hypothetical protein [Candidatus Woesearchaeota archaeon]
MGSDIKYVGRIERRPNGNLLCAMQGLAPATVQSFDIGFQNRQSLKEALEKLADQYRTYRETNGTRSNIVYCIETDDCGLLGWNEGCSWDLEVTPRKQDAAQFNVTGSIEREAFQKFHKYLCDIVRQGL